MITTLVAIAMLSGLESPINAFRVVSSHGQAAFKSGKTAPFWSFAVDCVDTGTSRKEYKQSNRSYGAFKLFANDKEWVTDTLASLERWGFNSTGGWTDDDLFRKYAPKTRLPYFVVLHLGAWDQAPWHDMFDKAMDHWVTVAAEKQIPKLARDPKLVGYFTDNELGWWDDTLFLSYLKMKPDAPGRRRLIQSLRDSYGGDFTRLQKDWVIAGHSFESIRNLHLRAGGNGRKAIDAWTEVIGRRYYSLMRDTIRRYDSAHLILGDRYCQYYTLPIVRAAKDYVDVVSTNFGADWNDGSIAPFFLRTLHAVTEKPVIVTEFYMCAKENRSGNKNSGSAFPVVQTQKQRADAFARHVREIASLPYTVGAHWFQFSDEPANGRGDGENFNMGLVDVDGRPYDEMIAASRALDLASIRAHAVDVKPRARVTVPNVDRVPLETLKGWPRERGVLPVSAGTPFGDLFVCQTSDCLYLGLYAMDYMDENLYVGGHVPEIDRNRWQINLGGLPTAIDVHYGGKGKRPTINCAGIEIHEAPGLKYTVILKIPRDLLHGAHSVALSSTLDTHGRSSSMSWKAMLDMDNPK